MSQNLRPILILNQNSAIRNFESDGPVKRRKKITKSKPQGKPRKRPDQRKLKRQQGVIKKRKGIEKRRRFIGPLPTSSPSFRPQTASSPRFSERHVGDVNNWLNDEEGDSEESEVGVRSIGSLPGSSPSFRPQASSSARFSERHIYNRRNWLNDKEE